MLDDHKFSCVVLLINLILYADVINGWYCIEGQVECCIVTRPTLAVTHVCLVQTLQEIFDFNSLCVRKYSV